ncbi:MAG: hypothetical protein ACLTZY_00300 [Alistipes indistinctus]
MEFTTKVIDLAKLTPEQVKVVCSVSGDNGENNQRKLGKDYPIGQPSDPVKKINFYTSTCFEGCDIYDENGVTFIVSDGNKSHTLLDISDLVHTDLRTVTGFQIQGRDYTRLFYDQVQPRCYPR